MVKRMVLYAVLTLAAAGSVKVECIAEMVYRRHDMKSAMIYESLSYKEAQERGYVFSASIDDKKMLVKRGGKQEYFKKDPSKDLYISADGNGYIRVSGKDGTALEVLDKDALVQYGCETDTDGKTPVSIRASSGVSSQKSADKIPDLFAKGAGFAFDSNSFLADESSDSLNRKFEKATLEISLSEGKSDAVEGPSVSRIISFAYGDNKDMEYGLTLSCTDETDIYFETALSISEEDRRSRFYICEDSEGKVQIKIHNNDLYLYPGYITVGKEFLSEGKYPDLDRLEIHPKNTRLIKGKPLD